MKKILIKGHDGLGDMILIYPICKIIREKYPNAKITAYGHSRTRENDIRHNFMKLFNCFDNYVFNKGEYVDYSPEGFAIKEFYADQKINGDDKYDLYITNVMKPDASNFRRKIADLNIHLVDLFALCMIGRTLNIAEKNIELKIDNLDYVKNLTGYENYISIEYWALDKNKFINFEEYLKMIPFLKNKFKNYAICFVGDKRAPEINIDGVYFLKNLSIENLLDVLKNSKIFLGIDSGLNTIAGMLGTNIIYYTNQNPYHVGPLKSYFNYLYVTDSRTVTADIFSSKIDEFDKIKYKLYGEV
jgi:ADP-heptose:LPS heptosyltransferase